MRREGLEQVLVVVDVEGVVLNCAGESHLGQDMGG
jgi:hypothetical protein